MDKNSQPPFHIDFVWTFCSNAYNKVISKYKPDKNQLQLFCQAVDDLKYSIRSVCMHAPFYRHIVLIIGDEDQVPAYLKEHHRNLVIVRHSEFMPADALPCFNSNVIESYIHKIPQISNHFLYFNDDTYISKPVSWREFFKPNGMPINRHAPGPQNHSLDSHPFIYVKMFQNAIKKYNIENTRYHIQVQPFRKDYIEEYANVFKRQLHSTKNHIYRQPNDFNLLRFSTCLSSTDGKAYRKTTSWNYDKFLESEDFAGVEKLAKATHRASRPTFICINNHGVHETYVTDFLKKIFHRKSPFET